MSITIKVTLITSLSNYPRLLVLLHTDRSYMRLKFQSISLDNLDIRQDCLQMIKYVTTARSLSLVLVETVSRDECPLQSDIHRGDLNYPLGLVSISLLTRFDDTHIDRDKQQTYRVMFCPVCRHSSSLYTA